MLVPLRATPAPLLVSPPRRACVIAFDGHADAGGAVQGAFDAASAAASAIASLVTASFGVAAVASIAAIASWLWYEQYVLGLRARRRGAGGAKRLSVPPGEPAYVRPRELWSAEELLEYDGSRCADGPILLAADGDVFNVARARQFYGPGGEYHAFAGRDATRFLARNSVEPESAAQAARPLSAAESAALALWLFSFRAKYDVVGRLATAAEAEAAALADERREAYLDALEAMSTGDHTTESVGEVRHTRQ